MTPLIPGNRSEAILSNSVRFYTGKLCRKGHDSERYTRNGACIECLTGKNSTHSEPRNLVDLKLAEDRREAFRNERLALLKLTEDRRRETLELRKAAVKLDSSDRANIRESKKASQNLCKYLFGLPHVEVKNFRSYAYILASLRDERLLFEHVVLPNVRSSNMGGGMGRYWVAGFPEDVEDLMAYARLLCSTRNSRPASPPVVTPLLEKIAEFRRTGFGENITPEGRNFPDGDPK